MKAVLLVSALLLSPIVGTVVAQDAPATKPAAEAKRDKPLPIGGKPDPKAPGYIVLLDETRVPESKPEVARLEKLLNFKATHVYDMKGFKGFAGKLSNEAVEKLRWELNVKSIERDGSVGIN